MILNKNYLKKIPLLISMKKFSTADFIEKKSKKFSTADFIEKKSKKISIADFIEKK